MDNNFFEALEKNGVKITPEQINKIKNRIREITTYEPKIGFFGKTGVGKSTLCNALFGKDLFEISDVESCTRNKQEMLLTLDNKKGIKLIDVPGVGESEDRDTEYSNLYNNLIPELDIVLWLIKADDRAMASDEIFYKNIIRHHVNQGKLFFFVLNQVDKIEPFREWDSKNNEPSPNQFQNIHKKIDFLSNFFGIQASKIIPVSANEKYNLTKLVDEIIYALPKDKRITVAIPLKPENITKQTKEIIQKSYIEIVGEVVGKVIDRGSEVVMVAIKTAGDVISKGIDTLKNFFGF